MMDKRDKITHELIKGGSIAFSGKILKELLMFPIKILLARFLGVAGLGIFSLGKNITEWIKQLSQLGLNRGLVKFISEYEVKKDKESVKGVIITAITLSILSSLILGSLLFLLSDNIETFFDKEGLGNILRLFSISLPFSVFTIITISTFRGFKKIDKSMKTEFLRNSAYLLLLSSALILGYGMGGATSAYLFSYIVSSVIGVFYLKKIFPRLFSNLKARFNNKKLVRFSIPLYFAGLTWVITQRTDILMLGYFTPAESIGVYSAVMTLSIFIAFPLQAISEIFSPLISELHSKKRYVEMRYTFQESTRLIYLTSIPIFLILFLFSEKLLVLIFGEGFAIGWIVLATLCVFELVNISVGPTGFILQMTNNQNWVLITDFFSAILNVFLNFVLIPPLGILGAGIATGIALSFNNLSQMLIVFKKLQLQPWDKRYLNIIIPVLSSITVFFVFTLLKINWLLNLLTIILIYVTTAFYFATSKSDRILIKNLLKRD